MVKQRSFMHCFLVIALYFCIFSLIAQHNLVLGLRTLCADVPGTIETQTSQGQLLGVTYEVDNVSVTGFTYKFPGVNQFLLLPSKTFGGPISIGFHAKMTTFNTDSKIMDFGYDDGTDNIRIGNFQATNTLEVAIHVNSQKKVIHFTGAFVTGSWHSYIIIIDNTSNVTFYRDGVDQAAFGAVITNEHSNSIKNIVRSGSYLGKSWNFIGNQYYNGELEEFVLYLRVLNASEIQCLADKCNNSICGTCTQNDQTCKTCYSKRENPPTCNCSPGLYEVLPAKTCLDCSYPCKTCVTSPKNCLTCHDEVNRNAIPDCSCNSLSWDNNKTCELLKDISFLITKSDKNVVFYNKEKQDDYIIQIQFSIAFTLKDPTKQLSDYLKIEIENVNANKYEVKLSQSTANPLQYQIAIKNLSQTARNRKITVGFTNHDQFQDWLNNPLEKVDHSTSIKDYYYYEKEWREISDTIALITQIFIYICLIPAVPLLFFDRFWKISIALDPLQLVYLLGFLNVRPSINGLTVMKKIDLFRSFNFPNLFVSIVNGETDQDYKFVTVYKDFVKNIEPILYVYVIFLILHFLIRVSILFIKNKKIRYPLRRLVKLFFEWRFHIDYWQMTMSILSIFSYIKYQNFDDSYQGFFAIFVGIVLMLMPIFASYQAFMWREKSKDIQRNEIGELLFEYNEFGEQRGYMYKNLWKFINPEKRFAIFFLPLFLFRKLFYTFILVSLKQSLLIQLSALMGMNFIYLILFIIRRPFIEKRDNIRFIFSELIMFGAVSLQYLMEKDDSEDEAKRYQQTWLLLYLLLVQIAFQSIFSMVELIYLVYILKKTKAKQPIFEGDYDEAQKRKALRKQAVRQIEQYDEDYDPFDNKSQKSEAKSKYYYDTRSQVRGAAIQMENAPKKKELTAEQLEANRLNFQQQRIEQDEIQQDKSELFKLLRGASKKPTQSVYHLNKSKAADQQTTVSKDLGNESQQNSPRTHTVASNYFAGNKEEDEANNNNDDFFGNNIKQLRSQKPPNYGEESNAFNFDSISQRDPNGSPTKVGKQRKKNRFNLGNQSRVVASYDNNVDDIPQFKSDRNIRQINPSKTIVHNLEDEIDNKLDTGKTPKTNKNQENLLSQMFEPLTPQATGYESPAALNQDNADDGIQNGKRRRANQRRTKSKFNQN